MAAKIIGLCAAVAAFLGLKQKPQVDFEARFIKAVEDSHRSWVEKGWIEEKHPTKV